MRASRRIEEGKPHRRLSFGARLGALYATNTARGSSQAMATGGLFLLSERMSHMADVFLDFAGGDGDRLNRFGLGVYLPFSEETHAPYIGLAGAFSFQRFGGQGEWGFSLMPVVGLMHARYDRMRLRVELGYLYAFFEEKEHDRLVPGSGQGRRSQGPQLTFGVSF